MDELGHQLRDDLRLAEEERAGPRIPTSRIVMAVRRLMWTSRTRKAELVAPRAISPSSMMRTGSRAVGIVGLDDDDVGRPGR